MALLSLVIGLYALATAALPHWRAHYAPFANELTVVWGAIALTHYIGAGIALVIGAGQFVPAVRSRFLAVHRWMGRLYVVSALAGACSGFAMATRSSGGLVGHFGFGVLALAWVWTTAQAYLYIRGGQIEAHRRWMIRSFSLTFAAVTLRIYLPIAQYTGIPFDTAYAAISWLAWVPNLALAVVWTSSAGRKRAAA